MKKVNLFELLRNVKSKKRFYQWYKAVLHRCRARRVEARNSLRSLLEFDDKSGDYSEITVPVTQMNILMTLICITLRAGIKEEYQKPGVCTRAPNPDPFTDNVLSDLE